MATKAELLALAERCEKATLPDRELDMDVEEAYAGAVRIGYWPERRRRFASGDYPLDAPKPYTASLDAAMTLVPEGLWAEGSLSSPGQLEVHGPCTFDPIGKGWAATPALALTAACLRARAATMGGSDD